VGQDLRLQTYRFIRLRRMMEGKAWSQPMTGIGKLDIVPFDCPSTEVPKDILPGCRSIPRANRRVRQCRSIQTTTGPCAYRSTGCA
jgi:hypothetical protein